MDGVRLVGVVAAGALVLLQLASPATVAAAAVPLALAGVVVGIPHGAVDHLVPFWAAGRAVAVRRLGILLAGYAGLALAALSCALLAPVPTLWVFLAVSALHFGRGEVVAAAERAGRPIPAATGDSLPTIAHGAVTVALPLAAWPASSLPLLDLAAPGFGATPSAVLTASLIITGGLVVAAAGRLVLHRRPAEAAELLLLATLFATVPPPAAFGVYFGAWHAVRHTDRLVRLPGPDGCVDVRRGLVRYARAAALPTGAALALLAVIAATGDRTVLTAALVTLIGLTAPHLLVVAALDGRRAGRPFSPRATGR